jgi:hypothetical protein
MTLRVPQRTEISLRAGILCSQEELRFMQLFKTAAMAVELNRKKEFSIGVSN